MDFDLDLNFDEESIFDEGTSSSTSPLENATPQLPFDQEQELLIKSPLDAILTPVSASSMAMNNLFPETIQQVDENSGFNTSMDFHSASSILQQQNYDIAELEKSLSSLLQAQQRDWNAMQQRQILINVISQHITSLKALQPKLEMTQENPKEEVKQEEPTTSRTEEILSDLRNQVAWMESVLVELGMPIGNISTLRTSLQTQARIVATSDKKKQLISFLYKELPQTEMSHFWQSATKSLNTINISAAANFFDDYKNQSADKFVKALCSKSQLFGVTVVNIIIQYYFFNTKHYQPNSFAEGDFLKSEFNNNSPNKPKLLVLPSKFYSDSNGIVPAQDVVVYVPKSTDVETTETATLFIENRPVKVEATSKCSKHNNNKRNKYLKYLFHLEAHVAPSTNPVVRVKIGNKIVADVNRVEYIKEDDS